MAGVGINRSSVSNLLGLQGTNTGVGASTGSSSGAWDPKRGFVNDGSPLTLHNTEFEGPAMAPTSVMGVNSMGATGDMAGARSIYSPQANPAAAGRIPTGFGGQNFTLGKLGQTPGGPVNPFNRPGSEAIRPALNSIMGGPGMRASLDMGVNPGVRPQVNAVDAMRAGMPRPNFTNPRDSVLAAYNDPGGAPGRR